ncbi:MAG: type I-MYXAN CRISPR-associated protein Cas6/Cmx6, partial [Pseudomonadota bacterium]
MFWQEDDGKQEFQVPDRVVDLLFSIDCREIPVDHAHALSSALRQVLPEIREDGRIGVHSIHVAGSQNGWERPDHSTEEHLVVSRRTKLTLRVPKERADQVSDRLSGVTLDVGGCTLTIGKPKERLLSRQGTIFSRYVVCDENEEELDFLNRMAKELAEQGIRMRKALCGKTTPLHTPGDPIHTRSLMLADLSPEESVRLQENGLGPGRDMGCGIFLP